MVYGIRYYGTGRITHDNYVQFIRHDALGFEYIDQSKNFVPQVRGGYTAVQSHQDFFTQVRKDYEALKSDGKDFPILMTSRDNILAQKSQEPDPDEALRYYQATFNYTENLREVLENLRLRIV